AIQSFRVQLFEERSIRLLEDHAKADHAGAEPIPIEVRCCLHGDIESPSHVLVNASGLSACLSALFRLCSPLSASGQLIKHNIHYRTLPWATEKYLNFCMEIENVR